MKTRLSKVRAQAERYWEAAAGVPILAQTTPGGGTGDLEKWLDSRCSSLKLHPTVLAGTLDVTEREEPRMTLQRWQHSVGRSAVS